MGGGGWNRSSLGLSCRTETPPQPHPIAASQEAREGLEVPFPVCVSTASQRLHFSYVSQRLTEMRLLTFLLGMGKGFEEPHPPLRTEQLWGLFLTPSFCVVFWFISRKGPVAKKGPRPTDLDNKRASPTWKAAFLCMKLRMKTEVWGWGTGLA